MCPANRRGDCRKRLKPMASPLRTFSVVLTVPAYGTAMPGTDPSTIAGSPTQGAPPDPTTPYSAWSAHLQKVWQETHQSRILRDIRFLHLIGLTTCFVCLALDANAGIVELGAILRLGVVVPAYLIAIWALRGASRTVTTFAMIVPVILYAGVAASLGVHAGPQHQDNYVMAASMLILVCVILCPLRFNETVVLAVGGFVAIALPVVAMAQLEGNNLNLIVFAALCCVLPLFIKGRSDRLKDANFLLTLESRQAQSALIAANRELEHLSHQDPLTGLLNRRGFEKKFQAAFETAQGSGEPLAVLLMDLDHFKAFNDTHGHRLGDECLIKVGGILKDEVAHHRGIAGRHGGEEFIAALSGSGGANAVSIAEGLRRKIAALDIRDEHGERAPITASIGARIGRAAELARENFVDHADEALYTAKDEGRDRVVLYNRSGETRGQSAHPPA